MLNYPNNQYNKLRYFLTFARGAPRFMNDKHECFLAVGQNIITRVNRIKRNPESVEKKVIIHNFFTFQLRF